MFSAKFLTEEERREVRARLRQDRTALADEYDIKYLFDALKDWKIYVHMLITIGKPFCNESHFSHEQMFFQVSTHPCTRFPSSSLPLSRTWATPTTNRN
jgi:hypothetical protein